MNNAIEWQSIESVLNDNERAVREGRAEKNTQRRDDVDRDLADFITSIQQEFDIESKGSPLDILEDIYKEIEADFAQKAMRSLRYRNLYKAMKAERIIDNELDYLAMRRVQLTEILNAQKKDGQISPQIDSAIRIVNARIAEKKVAREQIKQTSPEAFIGLHLKELKTYKEQLVHGRLAETPYFQLQAEKLRASLQKGRPTFIHGHLGSGKTEMAMEVSHDFLVDLHARRDFEQWRKQHSDEDIVQLGLQRIADNRTAAITSENGKLSVEDLQKKVHEKVQSIFEKYDKEKHPENYNKLLVREQQIKLQNLKAHYEDGVSKDIIERITPYLISGSKHTSTADLYGQKTLVLEHLNGKEVMEHNAAIEVEIKKWQEEHADLKTQNPEEYWREYELAATRIADIYKEKNFATGTAVKEVLNHVARAAQEGKPVIIDEVNAIPHEVLISLNHILTRRAGETLTLPGVDEPITIQKGFAIIYTGNLNQGINEQYLMREDMDPAHLSRLDLLAHDYLPQDIEGTMEQSANSKDAQLFHVILAMEMDEKGNVNLPEGDLEALWRLAQFARKTQDIFSGKAIGKITDAGSGRTEELSLKKSVCSIRDIKRVLEEYDAGRSGKTVSQAIWEKFIAQATVPADQVLLYQEARNAGLFPDDEGWQSLSINTIAEITRMIDQADVHPGEFDDLQRNPVFMGARDVVQLAYGKAPERTVFPEASADDSLSENHKEITAEEEQQIAMLYNFNDYFSRKDGRFDRGKEKICADNNG